MLTNGGERLIHEAINRHLERGGVRVRRRVVDKDVQTSEAFAGLVDGTCTSVRIRDVADDRGDALFGGEECEGDHR